jgi:hypothetical protein
MTSLTFLASNLNTDTILSTKNTLLFSTYTDWLFFSDESLELSQKWDDKINELEKLVKNLISAHSDNISQKMIAINSAIEKNEYNVFLQLVIDFYQMELKTEIPDKAIVVKLNSLITELEEINSKTIGSAKIERAGYLLSLKNCVPKDFSKPTVLHQAILLNYDSGFTFFEKRQELEKNSSGPHFNQVQENFKLSEILSATKFTIRPLITIRSNVDVKINNTPSFLARFFNGFTSYSKPVKAKTANQTSSSIQEKITSAWNVFSTQIDQMFGVLAEKSSQLPIVPASTPVPIANITKKSTHEKQPFINEMFKAVGQQNQSITRVPAQINVPPTNTNTTQPLSKKQLQVDQMFKALAEKNQAIIIAPLAPVPPLQQQQLHQELHEQFNGLISEVKQIKKWTDFHDSAVAREYADRVSNQLNEIVTQLDKSFFPDLYAAVQKSLEDTFISKCRQNTKNPFHTYQEREFYHQMMKTSLFDEVFAANMHEITQIRQHIADAPNKEAIDKKQAALASLNVQSLSMQKDNILSSLQYMKQHFIGAEYNVAIKIVEEKLGLVFNDNAQTEQMELVLKTPVGGTQSVANSLQFLKAKCGKLEANKENYDGSSPVLSQSLVKVYRTNYYNVLFNGTDEQVEKAKNYASTLQLFPTEMKSVPAPHLQFTQLPAFA